METLIQDVRYACRNLVKSPGFTVVAVITLGLAASFSLAHVVGSLLYGVAPVDPFTFVAGIALVAASALVASYMPARRATKVAPMVALRYE